MVRNPKINFTLLASNYFFAENGSHFLRKGVIGDWKNYFTVKQNEQLDHKLQTKLNGCGLKFDYE
ncbi:sulfotransferase 1C3-like [Glandiceps talaboti]